MLIDRQIEKNLLREGYAVVGKLNEKDLSRLEDYHHVKSHATGDFYYSLLNNNYESNKEILETQKAILQPFFQTHFLNYRTITESYLIKPANTENELLIHQDWSYTDEHRFQAYNVWIPLTDVNEETGALFFLNGSHLWFDNKRSGSLHTARLSSKNAIIAHSIISIPMLKGEVILFHPAVFHGSWPNRSMVDRVVVSTTVMDADAPFLYYQKVNEEEADTYQLDDDRFIRNLAPLTRGENPSPNPIERIRYRHIMVTEEMILDKIARHDQ